MGESDTYFAPISPAANTAASNVPVSAVNNNVTSSGNDAGTGNGGSVGLNLKPSLLLEMLQRGGQTQTSQGDSALPPVIRPPSIRDLGKQLCKLYWCLWKIILDYMYIHNTCKSEP